MRAEAPAVWAKRVLRGWRLIAALAALLTAAAASGPSARLTIWLASPTKPPIKQQPFDVTVYEDQSVRQDLRLLAPAHVVRVRLTNELGADPITIGAADLRKLSSGGEVGQAVPVRFGSATAVRIEPGEVVYSDPVPLFAPAFSDVAFTVYYPGRTAPLGHRTTVRVSVGRSVPSGQAHLRGSGILSAIESEAPAHQCIRTVVALGDSITEGAASGNNNYPSLVARRVADAQCLTVVLNAGISGNRVLSFNNNSASMLARLDRDVLGLPRVSHILFLEGFNDATGFDPEPIDAAEAAARIVAGYRQLVARAHGHGIVVIGGTLLPCKQAVKASLKVLDIVDRVNASIRRERIFDAVVDFNHVMADPSDPRRMNPAWHVGDWVHPNDAGYSEMAAAVQPSLFR